MERKVKNMSKLEDIISMGKLNELIHKNEEPEKKCNCVICILAVIGAIAAVAAIAYAVYRYFTPDYLEDFEDDDFEDDDFDDDFADEPVAKEAEKEEQ